MALAVSPDRRLLYVASRARPFLAATLAIDPSNGGLSLLSVAELPDSMVYLATDRHGRWLFSASFDGNIVACNAISEAGEVQTPATQVITVPSKPHSILPHPDNRHVYVASYGADSVQAMDFHASTGLVAQSVAQVTDTRPGAGPRHIAFGGDGRFAYVVNQTDATISTFAVSHSSGRLEELDTRPLVADSMVSDGAAADVHITQDGRRLFASDRLTDALYGFSIDPDSGLLSPIDQISAETSPRGFAIDGTGSYLVCAGQTNSTVGLYSIDVESGKLTFVARYPTGPNPNWVELVQLPRQ
jgi:6-phosphogluconolactonase